MPSIKENRSLLSFDLLFLHQLFNVSIIYDLYSATDKLGLDGIVSGELSGATDDVGLLIIDDDNRLRFEDLTNFASSTHFFFNKLMRYSIFPLTPGCIIHVPSSAYNHIYF